MRGTVVEAALEVCEEDVKGLIAPFLKMLRAVPVCRSVAIQLSQCGKAPLSQAVKKVEVDLTFEDSKEAFKSKTTGELIRAYVVLKCCTYDFLVKNNAEVSR